jgi:hypothetical protein
MVGSAIILWWKNNIELASTCSMCVPFLQQFLNLLLALHFEGFVRLVKHYTIFFQNIFLLQIHQNNQKNILKNINLIYFF